MVLWARTPSFANIWITAIGTSASDIFSLMMMQMLWVGECFHWVELSAKPIVLVSIVHVLLPFEMQHLDYGHQYGRINFCVKCTN